MFADSILDPAGPVALAQRGMLFDAVGLMLIVVAPVFILTPLIAWRYRARNTAARYSPDWENSRPIEIAIWLVPGAIVVLLWGVVWSRTHQLDPYRPIAASQPPLVVQAVGLDWQWLFIYPTENIASLNRLVFPAGRPLTVELTTDTVMNAFSIPALGGQIYAMPGMRAELNLLADAPGIFVGRNTQFSGDGFPDQTFPDIASTEADFESFLQEAKSSPATLDSATYAAVSKPTETPAQQLFAPVEPGLFAAIIAKYGPTSPGAPGDGARAMNRSPRRRRHVR
ncbi:MAG: cytochrome bo3 quinol oxidase subunit 2 [Devosia sp.]|uniref:COX aromatic rich motif-containing protein n=1 Tax=Devosia sp. TaxID=1871048 RepID=UPI00260227C8|nr:COX aromatic rich motif-containing protein [Devosia sp.]MDB5541102.1 cytochrome bo3 quinol oxidase subunit 2 [Devosia sp.]